MVLLLAVLVGATFGASDQYLGSLAALPWLTDVSLLSAPWLALPFIFGATQRRASRAVLVGSVATASALIGYFVMTLSPVEGVRLHGSLAPVVALLHSEFNVVVGAAVTAPLYGYLGHRWRVRRAWLSAVLLGGAFCLEPLAATLVGRLPALTSVWVGELGVGASMMVYFIWQGRRHRRRGDVHLGAF